VQAASASPSVSPAGARARCDPSAGSDSLRRVIREVESTEGRTDGQ
jgi:hypothetical protein